VLEFDWKKELGMDWHSLCPTKEEIEARKKAQRRAMFDKKKNLFKK